MLKGLDYYLNLDYAVTIRRMADGHYGAEIPLLKGCCGYGQTADEALFELEGVKETVLEAWLEQGRRIPEPTIRLEIPTNIFKRLSNRDKLELYVQPAL